MTLQAYLNSEEVLGRALEGHQREDMVIASKMGEGGKPSFSPQDIDAAVTQSLMRLKTDYIDLYQVMLCNDYVNLVIGIVLIKPNR